ncbi:Uncharacterised protein [Proteus mirabilis]|uniref:Uncharacterized protein n=1 Tax=Proteus mirabilis TaxID=584 RepID=A0A2X2CGZ3_PROMI|nr:Uncharacterised protein [Proteus mirabilis]
MLKRLNFILIYSVLSLISITTSVYASPSIGIGSMYDVFYTRNPKPHQARI